MTLSFNFKNGGMPLFLPSTNPYKKELSVLKIYHRIRLWSIYLFLLRPETHTKSSKATENYKSLSRSLLVHLSNNETITFSKAPKSQIKLITCINIDNRFDLIFNALFAMSTQLGGIGIKYQYLVISFFLDKGKTLTQFHFRVLQAQSDIFMLTDEKWQINNLTGK